MERNEIAVDIVNNISCKNIRVLTSALEDGNKGIYIILKYIALNQNKLSASKISHDLGISIPRITVVLNVLESKKLIEKVRSLDDKRKTYINITKKGMEEIKIKNEKMIEVVETLLDKLTITECVYLLDILKKISK